MHSDVVISVKNLSKTYRIFDHPGDRIKQALTFGKKQYHKEFTALKDVSFEIKKGETVGIIGRNGSGKSTLLQLICGILKPTSGSVTVNGRISALLELGAGFNPEFTGRENVYFQGALMGFNKDQMDDRLDAVIRFAEIGAFIDHPVRTYSSGMFMRLAFSTAMHLAPEILVLDEALAVGDLGFQSKCLNQIDAVRQQGGVVLLVSHSMEQVAHHCDRTLWLDRGMMAFFGATPQAIQHYIQRLGQSSQPSEQTKNETLTGLDDRLIHRPSYIPQETRWGDKAATIVDACLVQNGIDNPEFIIVGVPAELKFWCCCHAKNLNPVFGLAIKSATGVMMLATNSSALLGPSVTTQLAQGNHLCVRFFFTPFFGPGDYRVSMGITTETDTGHLTHDRRYDSVVLKLRLPQSTEDHVLAGLRCQVEAA